MFKLKKSNCDKSKKSYCYTTKKSNCNVYKFFNVSFAILRTACLARDTEVVLHSHLEEMTEFLEQFLHTLSPTTSLSCLTEETPGPGPGEEPGEEPGEVSGEGPVEELGEGPEEEPGEGHVEEPGEGPEEQGSLESGEARVMLDEDPWPPVAHTTDTPPSIQEDTDDISVPPLKLTETKDRNYWEDIREGGGGRRYLARQSQDREVLLGPTAASSSTSLSSPLGSPLIKLAMFSWFQNKL